jgi:hypothetical protein
VGEHLDRSIDRLAPYASVTGELVQSWSLLRAAAADSGVGSKLKVVRYFDDNAGEDEADHLVDGPSGQKLERLQGHHQLLGWHLNPKDR